MHFPTALFLSVLSISVSSIAAAPISFQSTTLSNLAERNLDAIYPEADLERRNNFMDVSDTLEVQRRDTGEEEMALSLRDLEESYHDIFQRDANGELSEVERRWNWRKALGTAAKIGFKAATMVVKREEMPELEILERDANDELSEVERRWNWRKALGTAAKIGFKAATMVVKREEMPELEILERDLTVEDA